MRIKNEKKALQMFCATKGSRRWMYAPFINDMDEGRLLATDGYVMIRVDKSLIHGKYEHSFQRIPQTFLEGSETGRVILFSDVEEAYNKFRLIPEKVSKDGGDKNCPECDGSGRVDYEYEDNSGNIHFHEDFCPVCLGTGTRPDYELIDTGRMILPVDSTFGLENIILNAEYVWRVVSALKLMGFKSMKWIRIGEFGGQAFSVCDGITVVIMERREKGAQHVVIQKSLSPEDREFALKRKIADCNLSTRSTTVCLANNVNTVRDLVKLRKRDFMKFRNAGKRTFTEMDDFLVSIGLTWAD